MLIASILLIVIAVGLIVISFFVNDKYSDLEKEMEQLSFDVVQDKYKLERKMKVLEEELLGGSAPLHKRTIKKESRHQNVSNEDVTISLYQKGYTPSQISQFTSTSMDKVESILHSANLKGNVANEN
jgi:FlaG/FlaF family flagellin (archaellin)